MFLMRFSRPETIFSIHLYYYIDQSGGPIRDLKVDETLKTGGRLHIGFHRYWYICHRDRREWKKSLLVGFIKFILIEIFARLGRLVFYIIHFQIS